MAGEDSGRGQKRPMPSVTRPGKVLSQERKFLDFFWDIAKPDQEIRLAAIEELLRYLQENQKVISRLCRRVSLTWPVRACLLACIIVSEKSKAG